MAGYPVVFVDAGGLPVTYGSDGNGWPIEEALSGLPVTIVAAGGLPVVEGVGLDPILAAFADGTDGFYFDFSKTDRLFQAVNSGVLADDAGESIALALESSKWNGRTLAQELAQQAELFPDGDIPNTTGWTSANATLTAEANGLKLLSTAVGAAARTAYKQFDGLTIGRWYYAELGVTEVGGTASGAITIRFQVTTLAGASIRDSLTTTGAGSRLAYFQATATSHRIQCRFDGSGADTTTYAIFDNISVKEVPRFHGVQTTGASQPKWQTGGLVRFDGTDDILITPAVAATELTMMFKGRLSVSGANSFVFATNFGGNRAYLGFDASGQLFANFGATAVTRTGNLATTVGVGAVTLSGGIATLYWQGAVAAGPSPVGDPNTTIPIAVGSLTTGPGAYGSFFSGDLYHALVIKKALAGADITAITNLWGTS